MLLGTFSKAGRRFPGLVRNGRVVDLSALGLPASLRGLLGEELPPSRLAEAAAGAEEHALEELEFEPVIPDPEAIWCAALTFESHVTEAPGRESPEYPLFFLRVAASQTGHEQPLLLPAVSDQLDYEGELAVIIGRRAHHVAEAEALDFVAGYSCYDDGSVRDWQLHSPQITPGKNFMRTGGFGPWMVTADEFGDPYRHAITTRVNGEVRQHESLDSLQFRIEYQIHYLSQIHPLLPGDVIVCGTPGGVGIRRDPPVLLEPGDVVTVEIDGIGTLSNRVLAEDRGRVEWRDRVGDQVRR